MPITGTTTLVDFEAERSRRKFIPYFSDTSDVGESKVKILTMRGLPTNPRFDLFVESKRLFVGDADFSIVGDQMKPDQVYRCLMVNSLASLTVRRRLVVTGSQKIDTSSVPGQAIIHGRLELEAGSELEISNGASVIIYPNGTLHLTTDSSLRLINGGKLLVYGSIYIPVELIPVIINAPEVMISATATIKVSELPNSRSYSLTDYLADLNLVYQPYGAEGAHSMSAGSASAGFKRIAGDTSQPSHVLDLLIFSGDVILGDLRLKLLGKPTELVMDRKSVNTLTVEKDARLIISTNFMGDIYISPILTIGRLDSRDDPGVLTINGQVLVNDTSSSIDLFDGGQIVISKDGKLILTDGGSIHHADTSSIVIIEGELIVDRLEQLGAAGPENYQFVGDGKLTVLNPSPANDWERITLFSIPAGLQTHLLTKLFGDRLDKVTFHVSRNCGIAIDTDMSPMHRWHDWYNNVRLELAIYEGWLVWHSGAFLEADRGTLPWITVKRGLEQMTKFFKSYRSTEQERLQDLVDRLVYAGSGDMVLRLTDEANSLVAETTLSLEGCKLLTTSYNPMTDQYGVTSDHDGEVYLVSPPTGTEASELLVDHARVIEIPDIKRTTFHLPT